MPFCCAPMRRIAALAFSFASSVVNCTRTAFMASKAWIGRSDFAKDITHPGTGMTITFRFHNTPGDGSVSTRSG